MNKYYKVIKEGKAVGKVSKRTPLYLGPGGNSPAVWLEGDAVRVWDRAKGADLGPRRVTGGSRGPWADRLRGVPEKGLSVTKRMRVSSSGRTLH